ncbi:hypothetical protein FRC12_018966 [Ceratobasidium sp. 428]|nr:hypothetical protein FRC12_018966 [Ceratobasidium sp. 428]
MKLNSRPDLSGSAERLRPFLLDRTGLTETMRIRRQEYTLGDLVMGGLLDGRDGDSRASTGDEASEQSDLEWSTGRAWLKGVSDISLQTPSASPSGFSGCPPPPPPAITVSHSAPQTTTLFRNPAEGSPVSVTPSRPTRSEMRERRSASLPAPDEPPKITVPPPAMTVNPSTRTKDYWRQQERVANGTTVSLNDWEGSPGWTNKPVPPTPDQQRNSKVLSKCKSAMPEMGEAGTKKKWWSWGRTRKISTPA